MIYSYKEFTPKINKNVFIAPSADVIGRITIGKNSSLWFNVTARADVHYISIGEESSVQDNTCLHVTNNKYPLNIGNRVTIGHSVTLHGCTIGDNTLIGMGATILDNVTIGEYCIVAAGALVLEGQSFPDGVLIAGFPAKIKREITSQEKEKNLQYARNYVNYSKTYLDPGQFKPLIKTDLIETK